MGFFLLVNFFGTSCIREKVTPYDVSGFHKVIDYPVDYADFNLVDLGVWRDIWVFAQGLSSWLHSCGVVKLIRLSALHNLNFLIENFHIV